MNIMEQQIATIRNLLPGARKSLPYMTEASEYYVLNFTEKNSISDRCNQLFCSGS